MGAEAGELTLDRGALQLPFVRLRLDREGALSIQFEHSDASRRILTHKLFTGGYNNEVDRVNVVGTLFGVARKVFQ